MLYTFDSLQRQSGTSNNFDIQLNFAIDAVKSIELMHCSIPNTFYNINSTNNTFIINESGDVTVTLRNGNYIIADLVTEITNQLSALTVATTLDETYTITYNSNTMHILISSTGSFSLSFGNSFLYKVIGFDNETYDDVSNAIESVNSVDLNVVKNFLINLNGYKQGQIATNLNHVYTFIIPVTGSPGELIHYNMSDFDQKINLNDVRIDLMHAEIRDQDYNFLDLNNANFVFTLKIINK